MNNEEKLIIENQLKSFTRFVLELEVEEYLKAGTEKEVMKSIAVATKRYKEELKTQINNSLVKLGIPEVYSSLLKLDTSQVNANLDVSQKLVNQFVKQEFGGY